MTKKRFTRNDLDNIQDNNPKGRLYILTERGGVNALCNLINGLNDKSNRLEKENDELKTTISNYMDYIDKLSVENERLKRKLELIEVIIKEVDEDD